MVIIDELHGKTVAVGTPKFLTPTITARDLIRARVELELENATSGNAPVIPGELEQRLNGYRPAPDEFMMFQRGPQGSICRETDALIAIAEAGFVTNRYFLLIDDRQVETLDDQIDLAATTEAVFLLLTPLQGG